MSTSTGAPESIASGPLRPVTVILVSLALLVPCFWQSRIQAGDLSSHLYNAWLTSLVKEGKAPGLEIAPQWTNVVFDLLLTWLLPILGVGWTERVAVSIAVLIFFWGAFALACALSGRRPWFVVPCLAIFTYGAIFHVGFFNFYTSLGLSCIFLALLIRGRGWLRAAGVPILALVAWLGHPLAVGAFLAKGTYVFVARRLAPRWQAGLFLGSMAAAVVLQRWLFSRFRVDWSWKQFIGMTGADQATVFGRHYWILTLAILLIWAAVLVWQNPEWRRTLVGIPAQCYALCAWVVFLLPYSVADLPLVKAPFTAIYTRMSLVAAVSGCALVGTVKPKRWHTVALSLVAAAYFALIYVDTAHINRIEDQMEKVVAQLPPGQRVVANIEWRGSPYFQNRAIHRVLRFLPPYRVTVTHVIDRVCIGRCFNYANYEPSTYQFRVRATAENPIVAFRFRDAMEMEEGDYTVKERDLPLYHIYQCGPAHTDLCLRALRAGEMNTAPPVPARP